MSQLENIEKLILKRLLTDQDDLKLVISSFTEDIPDNKTIGECIKLSGEYYTEYGEIPPLEYLKAEVSDPEYLIETLTEADGIDFDFTTHHQYFLDETSKYLKSQAVKQSFLQGVDIIKAGGDLTQLPGLIQTAVDRDLNPKPPLNIMKVNDFIGQPHPEREVMLPPWLQKNQYVIVTAEKGVGKTMFCMSLGYHLATGTKFYDWTPTRRYKVLYLDGEMSWYDCKDRIQTFNIEDYPDIGDYLYFYSVLDSNNTIKPVLTDPEFRKQVEIFCIDKGIEFVVFDNKASFTPGIEENCKTQEWDLINQWLVSLRSKGIGPCLAIHKGKNTKGTRGFSGQEDNNDITIELYLPKNYVRGGECEFKMKFIKMRAYINNKIKYWWMKYKASGDGKFSWIGKDTTFENMDMFICLALHDEISYGNIVTRYSMSPAGVTRKKTKLKDMGYLDNLGKLTDLGRLWTSDVEENYYENEKPALLGQVEVESETEIETG